MLKNLQWETIEATIEQKINLESYGIAKDFVLRTKMLSIKMLM